MLALRVRGAIETEGGKRKVHPKGRYTQKSGIHKRPVYLKGSICLKKGGILKMSIPKKRRYTQKRAVRLKKGGILKISIPEKEAVYLK